MTKVEMKKRKDKAGILAPMLCLALCGCQVLTYTAPTGERFTRSSLGSTTSLSSLSVVTETNGLRRVELRGYKNDSSHALGTVTDAAVRAAIQAAKPKRLQQPRARRKP